MNRFRFTLHLVAIFAFVAFGASQAQAQATRTWVSGVGDDINPCSRTAPCKTFSGAISKTAINGEINALDPGGFGTLTATKSITVDGTGTLAGILASSVTGVTVNLTSSTIDDPLRIVRLRNISINGTGVSGTVGTRTGTRGINISSANTSQPKVIVEDCVIDNFVNEGILFASNGGSLVVRNTSIRNVGTAGIKVDSGGANLNRASVDNSSLTFGSDGIRVEDGARVSITNTVLAHNTNGLNVTNVSGSNIVNIEGSMIAENTGTGIISTGPITFSTVNVSDCLISNNATGVAASSNGRIFTSVNNTLAGNTTDGTFTAPNNTLK